MRLLPMLVYFVVAIAWMPVYFALLVIMFVFALLKDSIEYITDGSMLVLKKWLQDIYPEEYRNTQNNED